MLAFAAGNAATPARAAEGAFSNYGMGSQGFGSGITPPPGFYVTPFFSYLDLKTRDATIGGVVTGNLKTTLVMMGLSALYVPKLDVWGGRLGLSLTLPFGHNKTEGSITSPIPLQRTVSQWGLGDVAARVQLGWTIGEFNHTGYIAGVFPTGRYDTGFQPILGLHRSAIDVGWGVTWDEKTFGLQVSGIGGFMFNFENARTNYDTGTEFHFEWAIGKTFENGLIIGPVGYFYQQISGDSGSGAVLGPLKGHAIGLGGGIGYTSVVGGHVVILSARQYFDVSANNHLHGAASFVSATIRF